MDLDLDFGAVTPAQWWTVDDLLSLGVPLEPEANISLDSCCLPPYFPPYASPPLSPDVWDQSLSDYWAPSVHGGLAADVAGIEPLDLPATIVAGQGYDGNTQRKSRGRWGRKDAPRRSLQSRQDDTSASGRSSGSSSSGGSQVGSPTLAPAVKLRSFRKARKPTAAQSPPPVEMDKKRRARTSHNKVEKKYRDHLNQQFELLLAALEATRCGGSGDADGGRSGSQHGDEDDGAGLRSISKASVLEQARQTLLDLERGNRLLSRELKRLGGAVGGGDQAHDMVL